MNWLFLVAFLALELVAAAKGLLRPHVPKVTSESGGMAVRCSDGVNGW